MKCGQLEFWASKRKFFLPLLCYKNFSNIITDDSLLFFNMLCDNNNSYEEYRLRETEIALIDLF